ncbi:aminoglycoside phosphotransferase family protein [Paenibacillus sp. MZ04-78.2]|uniref:phosphotransferase family protein n=1 Tax=Paenibacillus sp. MZ04-78.2 TaxID=2962034 RepID=UPI0020B82EC3|nr:aminoglycoside phosphotransferase family protein [Paenibacillus sp. MZ04-78.2]MCP3774053.1 aminoglycoside phosphotransferase family protein [Paenibacillus sp. MZ04-78.2]
MDNIPNLLKEHYDLDATNILPQRGGWAALAFKVFSGKQAFFLKAYEKSRASTPKLTALIDQYVPITVWLMQHSGLKGKLPVPVPTQTGAYKCEDDDGIYLLYEYIEGETVGEKALTAEQVVELSNMIAELHLYGEEIPVETKALKEDFAVPFVPQMRKTLEREVRELPLDVRELITSHLNQLNGLTDTVEKLSADLRNRNLRMALCHTDLHPWNLMQSSPQLMLIDWEGLKLAPVEADLMFLVDEPYFDDFVQIYRKVHNDFAINPDVLQFYRYRRKLEDIWEFMEQLLFDRQEAQERAVTLNYLSKELNEISG